MIPINIRELNLPFEWMVEAHRLTTELASKPPEERADFIENARRQTWAADEVLNELRRLAGNKCWYSEVALEGADPNIDHFRPKGNVREVDDNLQNTKVSSPGYWWLAFEYLNFRLAAMHSNQRRVDEDTDGGKWDYFPVIGGRASENTPLLEIAENYLALDPCSQSDVGLLWFDPDGSPSCSEWKRKPNELDKRRVETSIWLYHLKKVEIKRRRGKSMQKARTDLRLANAHYRLWKRDSTNPDLYAKNSFDQKIAEIKTTLADEAEFAGAKRCAVRAAIAQYEWIEEFGLV